MYTHVYVNMYMYLDIHTHTHTGGQKFYRLLDSQLFGIPFEEAKQLRIKGAFKKIKPTGQMGTLRAERMLRKRAKIKNFLFSVICLHFGKQKLTKCSREWILGLIFKYIDIGLSTLMLCPRSIYKGHYGLKLLLIGTLNYIYQTSMKTEYSRRGTFEAYLLNILQKLLLLLMHQLQN